MTGIRVRSLFLEVLDQWYGDQMMVLKHNGKSGRWYWWKNGQQVRATAKDRALDRARTIVIARSYGITLKHLGRAFGVVPERIRQIESRVHRGMRRVARRKHITWQSGDQ